MINANLQNYLNELNISGPVVVCVSGGVDSMVLLDLVIKSGLKPIIAHVNHHKREESQMEEDYLKDFAAKNNIPIEVFDFYYNSNENFQAEAHDYRYQFFYHVAITYGAKVIFTAHHATDNLETILMNIISGSNIYGYSGISEKLEYKGLTILRPLLHYLKAEIYDYAKENNIKFFEDSSNNEDIYFRNRIRHYIIPQMLKENPNLISSIANYSNQLAGAFQYLRKTTLEFLNGCESFSVNSFDQLDPIVQSDVINYLFEQNNIDSSSNKINDVINLIHSPKPNLTYDLGQNFLFVKSYDNCYLRKNRDIDNVYKEVNLYDTLVIENYGSFYFRKHNIDKATDYLALKQDEKFPLIIRNRANGDRIIIGEGHKKLKDFLIDKKVPLEERDYLLVVTDSNDEILWVVGYYKRKLEDEENAMKLVFERRK